MDTEETWEDQHADDEAFDDFEEYDSSYYDDDDLESETVSCAECGADVYEDAERCPSCGNYIVHSSSGYVWQNRPMWWIILGLLGILAVVYTLTLAGM